MRWKFVTQGGTDGYSRLIVFLKCSRNNTSHTMYEAFLEGIQQYHLPSRVRTDQGGENVLVAQHMIAYRGAERRSVITGSSVHNNRIERLWRDLHQGVTLLYYRLFYYLEQFDLLDPLNDIHLYALHYVFLPRINRAIVEFKNSWNYHSIRTARHKSPSQLFTADLLLLQHSQLTALHFFDDTDNMYRVDEDGLEPDDTDGTVVVPHVNFQISQPELRQLAAIVNPLADSPNHGTDLYEQTLHYIQSL